ncbi:GNAT family N-acetyltransferase [Rhodobacteraceae bacterium RKSG542]|uniref:GNAT family N-acetyltransferase n=1 Tax=Pseudovibrio flavus TaxID=2529854 RepID=UPI0012BD3ECB|nr:GNAT family N-acetyltransferase [Pseudovibrio flavus]MTI19178.1 GNAT family N-acetyltransferase [Pseudovibrio flavus]
MDVKVSPAGKWAAYDELSRDDLYDLLKLRCDVFIVEQNSVYADIDGLDNTSRHFLLRGEQGELLAYLRIILPEQMGKPLKIGRVVIAPAARGTGMGRSLMLEAIGECSRIDAGASIALQGQAHLEKFYRSFGFTPVSEIYDDGGIPHIDMVKEAA